jgi:hypothetical protein
MRSLLAFALVVSSLSCAVSNSARNHLDSAASMKPESHSMWARPQEVTYQVGDKVEGEASRQCVLFIFCWGDEGGAGGLSSVFGALTSDFSGIRLDQVIAGLGAAYADPLVRAASAHAVANSAADGLYLLSQEASELNFVVFSRRAVRVTGRAITFKVIGEVSQERADRERFPQQWILPTGQVHVAPGNVHLPPMP